MPNLILWGENRRNEAICDQIFKYSAPVSTPSIIKYTIASVLLPIEDKVLNVRDNNCDIVRDAVVVVAVDIATDLYSTNV